MKQSCNLDVLSSSTSKQLPAKRRKEFLTIQTPPFSPLQGPNSSSLPPTASLLFYSTSAPHRQQPPPIPPPPPAILRPLRISHSISDNNNDSLFASASPPFLQPKPALPPTLPISPSRAKTRFALATIGELVSYEADMEFAKVKERPRRGLNLPRSHSVLPLFEDT